MKHPNKENCLFVNLAEKLAAQNDIVSRTMEEIVENVVSDPNIEDRSDWEEICKMLETIVVGDLTLGSDTRRDVPKPKSIGKNRTQQKEQNLID